MRRTPCFSAVLAPLLLLPAGAHAAPAPPPAHEITCSSPRAVKDYCDGLAAYYLGRSGDAVSEFESAVRRAPQCPMAHWGLSRALQKAARGPEARAEAAKADELASNGDDREQKLISAWSKWLKSLDRPEDDRKKGQDDCRSEADRIIALYPDDPEVWLLRAEMAESPVRAAPFYLAALRVQPSHALAAVWKPSPPAAPTLTPKDVAPIAPMKTTPQLFDGLGKCSLTITTTNPQAQAYFDQGLRCFHSYVLPYRCKNGAAQCWRCAATLDPECAMAYWGISFCNMDQMKPLDAANRALALALKQGTDKERRFCAARLLELSGKEKREEFLDALDGAIAAYPEEVELWVWRGRALGGDYGSAGSNVSAIAYQQAAHRLAPEHPSPNHEMVHLYEAFERPALGWPYTEGYRRSAPNMPHANHMQAHLAMRLGRWQDAIDATRTSRQKSLAGFPELDPSHHIDILVRALGHEGRFKEAESEPKAYRDGLPWARLLQLKANTDELEQWAERRIASSAVDGYYIGAIAKLDRGDLAGAQPLMANVEEQWKKAPQNIYRRHEVRGRCLVQSGNAEEGLKLLREAAQKAVKDSSLHAWGGGSYMLEVWGEAALRAHRWDEAEEAFQEALAHEHGSVIGALGMQVVWEHRAGDPASADMVEHYAARAAAIWKDADAGALERQRERLRRMAAGSVALGG